MGDETTSSIFFDGRFWVAVVERRRAGSLCIGRHVFGPEPTNPELRHFYERLVTELAYMEAPPDYRPPKAERLAHSGGAPSSLARYKEAQRERAEAQRADSRQRLRQEGEEAYALRQVRRKAKKRGH